MSIGKQVKTVSRNRRRRQGGNVRYGMSPPGSNPFFQQKSEK